MLKCFFGFCGVFKLSYFGDIRKKIIPDPRDFRIFGIFYSEFSRVSFEIFKFKSRSPGFCDFRDFALGSFSKFSYTDPHPRDFEIFHSGYFRDFSLGIFFEIFKSRSRCPGFLDFRNLSIQLKLTIPIPNSRDRHSEFVIPKKSHPEANSA